MGLLAKDLQLTLRKSGALEGAGFSTLDSTVVAARCKGGFCQLLLNFLLSIELSSPSPCGTGEDIIVCPSTGLELSS